MSFTTRFAAVCLVGFALGAGVASSQTAAPPDPIAPADTELRDDTQAKRDDIRRMMDVSGAGDLGHQVMSQMIDVFRRDLPGVPNTYWDDFLAEADADADELVELCIPVYEKHFTHDEILQLLEFYETPLGQKLIQTQPAIMQECFVIGQEWGQDIARKLMQQLEDQDFQ